MNLLGGHKTRVDEIEAKRVSSLPYSRGFPPSSGHTSLFQIGTTLRQWQQRQQRRPHLRRSQWPAQVHLLMVLPQEVQLPQQQTTFGKTTGTMTTQRMNGARASEST